MWRSHVCMKKSRSFCHDGVGVCLATVAVSYASCYAVVAKVSHKFFFFFSFVLHQLLFFHSSSAPTKTCWANSLMHNCWAGEHQAVDILLERHRGIFPFTEVVLYPARIWFISTAVKDGWHHFWGYCTVKSRVSQCLHVWILHASA